MEPVVLLTFILNGGIIIIHVVSLCLLCSREKLRQSQFIRLVMCLSISDVVVGVGACYLATFGKSIYQPENQIHCLFMTNFVGRGSMIFSIFQRTQICMEQLNATFVAKKKTLTALASYKRMFLGFGVTFLSTIVWFIVDCFVLDTPCDTGYAQSLEYFASRDVPGLLLLAIMAISYSVVFRVMGDDKIQQRLAKACNQKPTRSEHTRKMVRRMLTLFIIVGSTIISYMPRMLFVLSNLVSDQQNQGTFKTFAGLTLMGFIHPLVDPFVYVFRLENVREELKPACCRRNQEGS